jgi:PAS domain S-box-containing protein
MDTETGLSALLQKALAERERIAASEEQFRSLVACADDTIVMTDLVGRIVFINESGRKLYGTADVADLVGANAFDLLAQESRAAAAEGMHLAHDAGVARNREFLLVRRDGTKVPVEITISLMRDAAGVPVGYMSVARDITERKRAEEKTAALLAVARAISGRLELWEILDRVQRRTAEVMRCDAVATFRWDPQRKAFRMLAQYTTRQDLVFDATALEFRRGVPFVDRLTTVRTVVIGDVAQQAWVPSELLARHGITALVWTQLVVREQPVGAFVALSAAPGRGFDASQVELFEGIADQLAVAIEAAELYHAQRQEAEVSAALARLGHELIGALDHPALLDRLCVLTSEMLKCEASHTILAEPGTDTYSVVAGHGYSAEQWEWIRVLKIPRRLLEGTATALERDDVVASTVPETPDDPLAILARQLGVTAFVCMALRRGRELIGIHIACCRERHEPFTPQCERIARGIAQLASLALQYRRLMDQLEQANRLKSDFVATLSHELRSPLNIIMGYDALLLERDLGELSAEQVEAVQRIDQTVVALLELIDSILDVSRLDAGRPQVDVQEVDVADLFATIEAETQELRETRPDVRFTWRVAPEVPRLRTDRMKLKIVLKNLIANALKFTEQGSVRVEAEPRDGGVRIAVADTGRGIPPGALPIIFEPFRQAPGTLKRHGGVGLGLYIVRRLLDLLQGTVEVESTAGRGATLTVWVPAVCLPAISS